MSVVHFLNGKKPLICLWQANNALSAGGLSDESEEVKPLFVSQAPSCEDLNSIFTG